MVREILDALQPGPVRPDEEREHIIRADPKTDQLLVNARAVDVDERDMPSRLGGGLADEIDGLNHLSREVPRAFLRYRRFAGIRRTGRALSSLAPPLGEPELSVRAEKPTDQRRMGFRGYCFAGNPGNEEEKLVAPRTVHVRR